MLSLKAYFDESGHFSDPNIHFTGMAGFVAPASVWAEVEEKWEAVRSEYALQDPFHMRLFAHNQGQFRDWEKSRKDSLYRSLIQILVEAELVPTGCVVSNSAFQSLNPRQQAAMKSPYFTAMQECVRGACAHVIALEPEVVDMAFARQVECGTLECARRKQPRQLRNHREAVLWNQTKSAAVGFIHGKVRLGRASGDDSIAGRGHAGLRDD